MHVRRLLHAQSLQFRGFLLFKKALPSGPGRMIIIRAVVAHFTGVQGWPMGSLLFSLRKPFGICHHRLSLQAGEASSLLAETAAAIIYPAGDKLQIPSLTAGNTAIWLCKHIKETLTKGEEGSHAGHPGSSALGNELSAGSCVAEPKDCLRVKPHSTALQSAGLIHLASHVVSPNCFASLQLSLPPFPHPPLPLLLKSFLLLYTWTSLRAPV